MMRTLLFICCSILFLSCNQNKNSSSSGATHKDSAELIEKSERGDDKKVNTGDVSTTLAKMAPLSEEEMKSRLPEKLMDGARSEVDVNSSMGPVAAVATYRLSDTTHIELTLIDCGGPAGAGIYNMQYLGMLGVSEEDENEYTKTIDFAGGKAFETCSKTTVHCALTFFSGRFLVSLEGDVPVEQLKRAAGGLNL